VGACQPPARTSEDATSEIPHTACALKTLGGAADIEPMSVQEFDEVLRGVVRDASVELTDLALGVGAAGIREQLHLRPALLHALSARLGADHVKKEQTLDFEHWQGLPGRRVGGVDLAVSGDDDHWRALIELKWCPLDGLYLGWAIWDFYKMATGRISPGADACYLVAGAPDELWAQQGTVGELFATATWDTAEVYRRHEPIWVGDGTDCKKLTSLPNRIDTVLVVDQPLHSPLADWTIKGIRVEAEAPNWSPLRDGRLEPSTAQPDAEPRDGDHRRSAAVQPAVPTASR
jgi:hypothetical protein